MPCCELINTKYCKLIIQVDWQFSYLVMNSKSTSLPITKQFSDSHPEICSLPHSSTFDFPPQSQPVSFYMQMPLLQSFRTPKSWKQEILIHKTLYYTKHLTASPIALFTHCRSSLHPNIMLLSQLLLYKYPTILGTTFKTLMTVTEHKSSVNAKGFSQKHHHNTQRQHGKLLNTLYKLLVSNKANYCQPQLVSHHKSI